MSEPRGNADDDLAALAALDLTLDELAAGVPPASPVGDEAADLAAALVVLAAVPAVARQARPGTALWPLRQVGQQLRVSLADDPARQAHLRLNIAEQYLAAGAGERRRRTMADRAEDLIGEVLDQLEDLPGPRAGAERARAGRLLSAVRVLEHQDDPGGGEGSSGGDDRSGQGGGDDGGGPQSKGGSSGSGPGSGSRRSGSGDD
jgi:hypothetical protein